MAESLDQKKTAGDGIKSQKGESAASSEKKVSGGNDSKGSNQRTGGINYSKWDKIVKDFEEEIKEEERNETDVFKELYEKSDEATRRAMNKSYVESGGKVLSMNWDEVRKKKVQYEDDDDDD